MNIHINLNNEQSILSSLDIVSTLLFKNSQGFDLLQFVVLSNKEFSCFIEYNFHKELDGKWKLSHFTIEAHLSLNMSYGCKL